jgi:predicted Zn-dependent protease
MSTASLCRASNRPSGVARACLLAAGLLGMLLAGCAGREVRDIQRTADTRQLSEAEARLWHAAEEADQLWHKKGLIYGDPQLTSYVQQVADALYPELRGAVRVQLVDSPELNAFALPNGNIYLNIGLVARMRNEAQLATVVAHEISHFTRQHSLKKRDAADSAVFAGMAVTILTGLPVTGDLVVLGAMSGYSQDMEREADQLGFDRLVRQGYDPSQAAEVFRLMLEEVDALDIDQPFLYSSHPKLTERIETMTEFASKQPPNGAARHKARFDSHTDGLRSIVLQRYLETHRYQVLILLLENRALRIRYPDHAGYFLAEAYRQRAEQGDAVLAEHAYRQALVEAPGYAPSHRGLGLLLMKAGNAPEAARHLQRYLVLAPDAADRGYIESYLEQLGD